MPIPKKSLPKAEKAVTFYAYTQGADGQKLAPRTKIILFAKEIEDRRTGRMTFDPLSQRVAIFQKGVYQTDIIEDIETLRAYNKNNKHAKITISETLLSDNNVKIIERPTEKTVMPLFHIKSMKADDIRTMMKEIWKYTPNGDNVAELLAEGEEQGFFV